VLLEAPAGGAVVLEEVPPGPVDRLLVFQEPLVEVVNQPGVGSEGSLAGRGSFSGHRWNNLSQIKDGNTAEAANAGDAGKERVIGPRRVAEGRAEPSSIVRDTPRS
jgi:hypothetical protein